MSKFPVRHQRVAGIDLETVRETLLYMLSDCRDRPGLEGLAAALTDAIARIDEATAHQEKAAKTNVVSARFLPAGL